MVDRIPLQFRRSRSFLYLRRPIVLSGKLRKTHQPPLRLQLETPLQSNAVPPTLEACFSIPMTSNSRPHPDRLSLVSFCFDYGVLSRHRSVRLRSTILARYYFASTRLSLLSSHFYTVARSKHSMLTKISCFGVLASYVFQFRKWGRVIRSLFAGKGVGGAGKKLLDDVNSQKKAMEGSSE